MKLIFYSAEWKDDCDGKQVYIFLKSDKGISDFIDVIHES
jgi:hypothetical protein